MHHSLESTHFRQFAQQCRCVVILRRTNFYTCTCTYVDILFHASITILPNQSELSFQSFYDSHTCTFFSTQGLSHAHMLFRVYEFLLTVPVLVGLDYGNLEVPCRGSIFVWQYLDSFSYDRIGQQEGF